VFLPVPALLLTWLACCAGSGIAVEPAALEDVSLGLAPHVAPPADVKVFDTPNDDGESVTITWELSTADREQNPGFAGYLILRSDTPDGPFAPVGETPGRSQSFIDRQDITDGRPYYYRVVSRMDDMRGFSDVTGPVVSKAQWLHTGRVNTLVAVIMLSALIIYFIERARKGNRIFIRKIAGLDAVDEAVGRATEMGKKILYIPGIMDMNNVQTLAGISILGRVARTTAQYDTPLEVPVARSLVMVACRETVKESYISEGRPDAYSDDQVYYLTDDQFGYAAAIEGMMVREKPATIFMQGCFYAESLILAETGNSIGAIQIAGTAMPSQLPFFVAACDYTLIGEELFAAGAYLSREPRQLGSLKGQDMGKGLILIVLFVGIILQTLGVDVARLFQVQ